IHHVNERLREHYAEFRAVVAELDDFVRRHRQEPGFGLAVDMRPTDPFPVTHSVPFPLVLFAPWIDNHAPSHVVSFPDGRLEICPAADYRRQHGTAGQLFPDLVRIGSDFNIYFWRGRYYGTLHWDDIFRPDLKDHSYVIEGATIQEVLAAQPARYQEFLNDLRTGWCIPPRLGFEIMDRDYRGFQLVRAGAYCYAVPADEGKFQINRFNARRYSRLFVAEELTVIKEQVDAYADRQAEASVR
ncbi:MAG: hypothetical protein NZO58_08535, partial [Gemmataceae bacterium]|nr:hypothetical protein [Gemmataceae bacterium]